MVSFKDLIESEDIEFYSGRQFKYGDTEYLPGDQFPSATLAEAPNRESLIRGRYAIPTVASLDDVPRQYGRHVMLKTAFDNKYPAETPLVDIPQEEFEAQERSVSAIQAYYSDADNDTVEKWAYGLLDEWHGERRQELIDWFKAGEADVDPQDLADFIEDESNYDAAAPLEDFTFDEEVYAAGDAPDEAAAVFFPGDYNVQEVEDWLGENVVISDWAYALLSEQANKNRSTLVTFIKAAHEPDFDAAALQAYVEDAGNYDPGDPLEDFTPQDGLDAY